MLKVPTVFSDMERNHNSIAENKDVTMRNNVPSMKPLTEKADGRPNIPAPMTVLARLIMNLVNDAKPLYRSCFLFEFSEVHIHILLI